MFKSYLKLALRNLWKHKTTTAINILSLSVGLASCALVFLFCQHELSFDKGFDHNEDIYRITSIFRDGSTAPIVAFPYVKYLKSEIPEIEQVSRLDATNGVSIVQAQGNGPSTPYSIGSGYWVDPQFFEVLSFNFLRGRLKTAFEAPNTIVLSASLAKKLFGQTDPIGKILKTAGNTYTITGVFKEDFLNHIQADFFASNKSGHFIQSIDGITNWVVNPNYYTYIKLKHGSNVQHVINELKDYTKRHAAADMKSSGDYMTNSLQALNDIHLHSSQFQDYLAWKQGNIQYLYLLCAIALIILLLGCINYMNLTTAQAIGRAREVGVRRVMGAGKGSIRYQFLIETLAISLFALVVAIVLSFLFLPIFNNLTGQALSFFAKEDRSLIVWILLITLITGLLAGTYPAFYLSSFKAVQVLKGKVIATNGVFNVRKLLIISQFVISTILIFATIVIWDQLNFMINTKPGFDQDQQLVLNLNSVEAKNNSELLISQLKSNPNFKSVSGASDALVSGDMNFYPEGKTVNDKHDIFLDLTDENYIKTLGLQLIAGSNFTPQAFTNTNMQEDLEVNDIGRQVILNEEAVKALGFDTYTAPGKYISHLHNGVVYNYKIIGVVKNYHYFSLHAIIGSCAIMPVNPKRFGTIVAKVDGHKIAGAIKYATQKWKALNPDTPFSYGFLNELFQGDYLQDQRAQQMSGIFTCVAIFVSCLGLLGLVTYSATQKAREIGIRKVVGASVVNIVMLFSKQYLKLILIANIIAWPLAWYFMNKWLLNYPYRIQISWWMFAISLSAGIIVAFSTISFKTIKAAMANPVNSLRVE
ncbi:MAG: macB 1 [Mucilaginibacter sp.]|nr:macB 1 [Mucilaginibacter sp.]